MTRSAPAPVQQEAAADEEQSQVDMPSPMPAPAAPPPPAEPKSRHRAAKSAAGGLALDTITVSGSNVRRVDIDSKIERYAQSTVLQTGAGEASWDRGQRYELGWSGRVVPEQTVRLLIAPPWLVRLLRVLLVGLMAWLAMRPFAAFAPERFIGLVAPRPIVFVNGVNDPQMPVEAVRRLFDAAHEPKSAIWLRTGHLMPTDSALIRTLVDTAFATMGVLRAPPDLSHCRAMH